MARTSAGSWQVCSPWPSPGLTSQSLDCQFFTQAKVQSCPAVLHPKESTIKNLLSASAEKHNPELYASNVAQLMSKKSGLPICKKGGIEYLDDIRRMKELHPEMDLIGWRGLFACSSELQASNLKNCTLKN